MSSLKRIKRGFRKHVRQASGSLAEPAIAGYSPRVRQWMLRLLCDCGVVLHEDFNHNRFIADTSTLLPVEGDVDDMNELGRQYIKQLEECSDGHAPVTGPLAHNLDVLGEGLRMSRVEKDILALQVMYRVFPAFEHLVDVAFPRTDAGRLPWQMARMLGCDHDEIEHAFKPECVLIGAGLMRVDECISGANLSMVLELNKRVLRLLTHSDFGVEDLLNHAAHPSRGSDLVLQDFDYMAEQRELVQRYLDAVKKSGTARATVLFDGPPGVGKSELARVLARELGFEAFEINELDPDGDPATPMERMQYLHLCERMIERNGDAMLIFDEADAVLGASLELTRRFMRGSKAGLIRVLETLRVPMIWITNHAELMDPAIARRFDLTIRFRDLPRDARERMIRKTLPDEVREEEWVKKLGGQRAITPARIAQAEDIARTIAAEDDEERARLFQQVIRENLDLRKDRREDRKKEFELPYRLDAINADEDLPALVDAVKRSPCARLCLYGPPGTGKTRFVGHLAEEAGLQLAEYRASDLLDKFVGESESNIRRMFEENDRPDRLLLLDEADSLIASRAGANQQWQINQVNELLKGLEGFQGLFVASTNLMGNLDSAVMRRLDFKLHFGWLKEQPRWCLFLDLARHVGLTVRGGAARKARRIVDDLDCLTPGDFAMLARRLTIRPHVESAVELAQMLEKEMKVKPEAQGRASIGFTARL